MLNYDMMSGTFGGSYTAIAWFSFILADILMVMGIIALWKYLMKK